MFSLALTLFVVPAFYTYLSSAVADSGGEKPPLGGSGREDLSSLEDEGEGDEHASDQEE